ncbi:cobaltochelatase subunit CobN, partial [Bordetella petrii]|uniref:cobaltochelatase subunit CobN n=1 Tax=Bordetella petrii TaxID=94624 RepID=UPI001E546523
MACPRFALWLRRVVPAVLALWLAGPALAASGPVVLVLHNSFVSAEKFQRMQAGAARQGVALRHLDVGQAAAPALRQAVEQAALLVVDSPRPNDRAAVLRQLQQVPRYAATPGVTVGGGRPAWQHLSSEYGAALAQLYAAGGAENFGRFFALARAVHDGVDPPADALGPPDTLPATGFYHPDAPRVYTRVQDYLQWYEVRPAAPQSTGKVAFLVHQGVVSDLLTREVDDLVRRAEAGGLLPIVFWFDGAGPQGLQDVLDAGRIDALVNLSHMQNGAARSRDFLVLDVPVIQTLRFREGTAADWPAAHSGVAPRTTAVFLAGPEGWGISDPLVLSASTDGTSHLLPRQADALVAKLRSLAALRHTPPARKRLALMFWNYPAGEKNLGASNLNIPRSLVSIQAALASQGYQVGSAITEAQAIETAQRMLGALYDPAKLDALLADGLAALYPLADYADWLAGLPEQRQAELRHAGDPEKHRAVREIKGRRYFVIPRWQLGQWLVMPQMPRHAGQPGHYHDTASAPDHLYMAAYRYLQESYAAHALIHLGTHGTQEWLPGKDRGLADTDYPWLAVGSLPVFYPYIQDNVGEAIQAKRRGRAVVISHQTPPFAPAGLYDQLRDLHHLIHEYQQLDDGMVREQVSVKIRAAAIAANLHADIGWTAQQAEQDFPGFLQHLHDHLHELARSAMPLGLHVYGQPPEPGHRVTTIMQQLGRPFFDALGVDQEELFAVDPARLPDSAPYRAVARMLDAQAPDAGAATRE